MFQRQLTVFVVTAFAAVEAGVAVLAQAAVLGLGQDIVGRQQGAGEGIHTANVGVEDVFQVGGVAAGLGVEVDAAALEATGFEDDEHGFGQLGDVGGELVRIPTVLVISAVGVDGAEEAVGGGNGQLVLEGVLGQGGVVDLDVELEVVHQVVLAQEPGYGGGVEVVLVLAGLEGLRLDEEGAGEALLAGVVAAHRQELGQVVHLAAEVGIEQAHVALAAAPEDVVLPAEFDGGVDGVLDLGAGVGHDVEVGVGTGAVHVARVAEEVGRAPEDLLARGVHFLLDVVGYRVEALFVGSQVGVAFLHQVHVVEAEVVQAEFIHNLEAGVDGVLRFLDRVAVAQPGVLGRAGAEGITAGVAQGVPPGHGELEVLGHGLAGYDLIFVVVLKREGVIGVLAFEFDPGDFTKVSHCSSVVLIKRAGVRGRAGVVLARIAEGR